MFVYDDLARIPPVDREPSPPTVFDASARALASWLDVTGDPRAVVGPAVVAAIEDAASRLADERRISRQKLLTDVAVQRIAAETARNALEVLAWADSAVYHAWRLVESLRIAAGGELAAAAVRHSQPGVSQ